MIINQLRKPMVQAVGHLHFWQARQHRQAVNSEGVQCDRPIEHHMPSQQKGSVLPIITRGKCLPEWDMLAKGRSRWKEDFLAEV